MGNTTRAIILSDIHLGPENDLCTFRDDVALAAFIERLARPDEPATEMVLAGDCFDFLQSADYIGFDASLAAGRFGAILQSPRTSRVISALRGFAARAGNEITLLSGNHDPEMLLPDVRGLFEEAIGRRGSVRFADDEPLRAADGDRPPVWGRALGEPDHPVWVVHGDRWDPSNMIHRDRVRELVRAGQPVALPVGSHLVFEILRHIKPTRGWIDELKPEGGVFLLLLYLDFEHTAAFLLKHYRLTAALLDAQIRAQLRMGPLFGENAPAPPVLNVPTLLAGLLAEDLRAASKPQREVLLTQLDERLGGKPAAAEGTFAAHDGVPRLLLRAWLLWMRHADRFQDPIGPDSIPAAAARYLPDGLAALIAGHTHGPRALTELRPAYFNTGTWIPVGKIPPGDLKEQIDQLDDGPTWPADSPRSFVQIDLASAPARVALGFCDRDGTPRADQRD
jgi:UDP-2,3-diacylglucosamine pyrophosphatase LpxH